MSYATPKTFHEHTFEIKKSRFIAWAEKVTDRNEAMAFLKRAQTAYPDARHHCWAYQIGNPKSPTNAAMSDDGEPSGTAGKPILNVLQHKDVGDVMVIVIRYFGGIKLGAGGLVRAYSSAAEKVMSTLEIEQHLAVIEKTITVDFSQEQRVRHWLAQHNSSVIAIDYGQKVTMTLSIAEPHAEHLQPFLDGL